jgi:hypothetical protein
MPEGPILLEELVPDDRLEALLVATDAPNHAKHCIEVLNHECLLHRLDRWEFHVAWELLKTVTRIRSASRSHCSVTVKVARLAWSRLGHTAYGGEMGRVRGEKGSFYGKYQSPAAKLPIIKRPPLLPDVPSGGHGGSHDYLTYELVTSILQNRKPLVDIGLALDMTVARIVAHHSALNGGELIKTPPNE